MQDDEIDLRQILRLLYHYRISIVFFVLLFTAIAAYIAYFKPSVYTATSLIKIKSQRQGYYEDFLYVSPAAPNQDIQDETVVISSLPIIQKALEPLSLNVRYYTKKRWKETELYTNVPFQVDYDRIDPRYYGKVFQLTFLESGKYRLRLVNTSSFISSILHSSGTDRNQTFDKIYHFGQAVTTPYFSFRIEKKADPSYQTYYFTITSPSSMIAYVQHALKATTLSKYGRIVRIQLNDYVPQRAALIANRIAQAYIDYTLEQKNQSAKKQLHFIDMQLEAINKKLQHSAQKLQSYKAMNIVIDLSDKSRQLSERLATLESDLYKNRSVLNRIETTLKKLEKSKKNLHPYDVNLPFSDVPDIAEIVSQLRSTLEKYETLSVNYTKNYPGIQKLIRQIKFLKHSLIQALQEKRTLLISENKDIKTQIAALKQSLKNIPEQEQQIEVLNRHFLVNEKIYSYLLEKRAETAILASSTIADASIVQKAYPPSIPSAPNRKAYLLIGLVTGFLFGIIQAFVRNFFDIKIHSVEEIETLSEIPIYAKLPIKEKTSAGVYSEAIRSLWINLSFITPKHHAKIIAVTSDTSKEGKTFTVTHLAKTISQITDKKTVLIDMDMRKPSLHEMFKLPEHKAGLSTYLAGNAELSSILMPVNEKLTVIPAGPKAPNPTKLILSEKFRHLIDTLSQSYDYILIDTSPIGIVSDAYQIIRLSDITLFIVRIDHSTKTYVQTIQAFHQKTDGEIGIVVNGVVLSKSYYHNYVYKHYYTPHEEQVHEKR